MEITLEAAEDIAVVNIDEAKFAVGAAITWMEDHIGELTLEQGQALSLLNKAYAKM